MYVGTKEAGIYYTVTGPTLRKWATCGRIKYTKTPGGNFRYWIDNLESPDTKVFPKSRVYLYTRVSSTKQKNDLERQSRRLCEKYPEAILISEVGSAITFRRRGVQQLLQQIHMGKVSSVIVTHKDRITRFGFDLFEWICKVNGTNIVVEEDSSSTPIEELVEDMLSITHSFSSKMYSKRRLEHSGIEIQIKQEKDNDNDKSTCN